MKIRKFLTVITALLIFSNVIYSQDRRTLDTKVADILARLPANSFQASDKIMTDILSLGEAGIKKICDEVIPAGTGDDTRPRFAIESLSRFLSGRKMENEKVMWEKICIGYLNDMTDIGIKDFFMKQLQQIGGDQSIEAVKKYLTDKDMCNPAVAVIQSAGGTLAEKILAESLKNKQLPCAATVMNTLAAIKSDKAVNEYIFWSSSSDVTIRASALNALAQSGSKPAYQVLSEAAKKVSFQWEPSGATAAFINYALLIGQKGDINTADKICKIFLSGSKNDMPFQYKSSALETYVKLHGAKSMDELFKAMSYPDSRYRNAALRYSLSVSGQDVVKSWMSFFYKAIPDARPEIIHMLGERSDTLAVPLLISSLSDKDINVRTESSGAIARLYGRKSIPALIDYMIKFSSQQDQEAAKSALKTICGNDNISQLLPVLNGGGSVAARKSIIELLAWNKAEEYFSDVFPYTSSAEEPIRSAAFKALKDISSSSDQNKLIALLASTNNDNYIKDVQEALSVAACKTKDPQKRSSEILQALGKGASGEKLIPVLSQTGGMEAISVVMKQFENGNPEMRDIYFKTLTEWKDNNALSALFSICASGNKTFEDQAFHGFIQQVKSGDFTDEQKLLLFRKIMQYALSAERKNEILTETGNLKTYQALFFVAAYLDDPSTSAVSASSAISIALPSSGSKVGMYGNIVRSILMKASDKLAGAESAYTKAMVTKYLTNMPADEGFEPMFNGKDLSGWQGLVENPVVRAKMSQKELAKKQVEADKKVTGNWSVKDGCIWFNGEGDNLCSVKEYGDFEMLVDWKITKKGDSGIYLRGSPQVQIWDTSRTDVGAQVGSGGLYNNQINRSTPLMVADNPVGDWNTFRIKMIGEKVSVWLNGILVVDNVTLENYWDRKIPIFPKGPIELQAHGTDLAFRDIYVREISDKEYNLTPEEKADGFTSLFNGRNIDNWVGDKHSYVVEDGMIVVKPVNDSSVGNLYTEKEYSDFNIRFEFQLTHAANNGLGIRAPLTGDAAYVGMELQILDDSDPVYANLQPYQYHGSVYGVIPSRRGFQKPVGEWNYEEVTAQGTHIKIILNGNVIVDGDIAGPRDNGTMDHKDHPGLKNTSGHIGFLGHGSEVKFRNIRIKDLSK